LPRLAGLDDLLWQPNIRFFSSPGVLTDAFGESRWDGYHCIIGLDLNYMMVVSERSEIAREG
jgi:hypothetical protein